MIRMNDRTVGVTTIELFDRDLLRLIRYPIIVGRLFEHDESDQMGLRGRGGGSEERLIERSSNLGAKVKAGNHLCVSR